MTSSGVCLSNDGQLLYVAQRRNGFIEVLSVLDGSHVQRIFIFDDDFKPDKVFMSPTNELFVLDTHNHRIHVFDVDGNLRHIIGDGYAGEDNGSQLEGEFSFPTGLCFSPDGRKVFVADGNGEKMNEPYRIQVFNNIGGSITYSHKMNLRDIQNIQIDCLCISHDGQTLFVSDSVNNFVHVFEIGEYDLIHNRMFGEGGARQFAMHHISMCLSRSGEFLFINGDKNRSIQMLNVLNGARVQTFGTRAAAQVGPGQFGYIRDICVSHEGTELFAACDGRIEVFRV